MHTIYRLNANELSSKFVEGIKAIFKDKEIEIAVYEVDETEYLMKSEANKKRLLEAIKNIKNDKNLIKVNLE